MGFHLHLHDGGPLASCNWTPWAVTSRVRVRFFVPENVGGHISGRRVTISISRRGKPVRKYLVEADAFFSQRINSKLRSYHDTNSALCRAAISELIEAYSLGGKSVLSIGSKVGHEEVWFYRAGCPLTLCDIDEHGDVEPVLQQLPVGNLAYYICDVRDFPKGRFDVLYLSSFTPDELYKTAVRGRNTNLFRYALRKMGLADRQDYCWPDGVSGFDALVSGLFGLGETFILQSYASPIRADDTDYQQAVLTPLREAGFVSIDLYYQEHRPSTHVIVASRDSATPRRAVSHIHGRGVNREDLVISRRFCSNPA